MTTLINTEELASKNYTDSSSLDPIQVAYEDEHDSIREDNNFGSKPVTSNIPTSSSDTSSNSPTSPSCMNPLTPERQHSPPHDNTTIVTAMNEYDALEDHFPNPYDDPPPLAFTHARVHSAPPMQGLLHPGYQQPSPRRMPSILRPSHPKAFDTIGSRRASLALSAVDFDNSPLTPLGFGGEGRLSVHSTPSLHMHMDEDSMISSGYPPWQPRRSSPLTVPTSSPPSIDDQHQGDDELHIEVSERFVDGPPSDAGPPEMPPVEQPPKRQSSGSWPGGIPVLRGGVKKTPRWKFWARRSSKIPNKS